MPVKTDAKFSQWIVVTKQELPGYAELYSVSSHNVLERCRQTHTGTHANVFVKYAKQYIAKA